MTRCLDLFILYEYKKFELFQLVLKSNYVYFAFWPKQSIWRQYEEEPPPHYLLPLRILKFFFLIIIIYTHSYYEPKYLRSNSIRGGSKQNWLCNPLLHPPLFTEKYFFFFFQNRSRLPNFKLLYQRKFIFNKKWPQAINYKNFNKLSPPF